jgi:hypothetical protein
MGNPDNRFDDRIRVQHSACYCAVVVQQRNMKTSKNHSCWNDFFCWIDFLAWDLQKPRLVAKWRSLLPTCGKSEIWFPFYP